MHGALVAAWLAQGADVVAPGPFFDPEEVRTLLDPVPQRTRVWWLYLSCTYEVALQRVLRDPRRNVSSDSGFLKMTYDRVAALRPSMPPADWTVDTTATGSQDIVDLVAQDLLTDSRGPRPTS